MSSPCEACECVEAEVVDPCDDAQHPYRLCARCHSRLHTRALRPLEWYNLAKRHGHQYLLHDDFYDDDGTAAQPEGEVERPEDFPAPRLAAVRENPASLLDYSITRWFFDPDVAAAWSAIPRLDVQSTLCARFNTSSDIGIRARILTI